MSDPQQSDGPSEEELQAYMEQMRQADPSEVVAQAFNLLATGAQVKLGRPDGRVIIDGLAGLTDAVQPSLPDEVHQQMSQAVQQLQTAQVQAEQEGGASAAGAGAAAGAGEAGAGQAGAAPQGGEQPGQQQSSQQGEQRLTDRLWVPGR